MGYKQDIHIDQDALDLEWLQQPQLAFKYNEEYAQARREADEAKEALEVVKAEVGLDIRKNPSAYTGEDKKPTEDAVKSLITIDERVRKAEKRFAQAKETQSLVWAAVTAIDTKKSALEALVKLHGQSYFAGPSVPLETNRQFQEEIKEKKTSRNVDRMKKVVRKRKK